MDLRSWLLDTVLIIPAILIAFTVHSYAQAAVADKLGDKNPRAQGRLTLNPLAHVDLIGFLMILVVHFGWAKPVETNPKAYKNYYKDDLKVSVSGIIANFITAIIFAIVYGLTLKLAMSFSYGTVLINILKILLTVFFYVVSINCMFGIINIIPIPGLDGFHIMRDLFPKFFYKHSGAMYRYQMIILIAFIIPIFGNASLASFIVGVPSDFLANLLLNIAKAFA